MSLSEYVKKAKEDRTDLAEVVERRKKKKLAEIEEAELDVELAKAKKTLQDTQETPQSLQGQAQNFVQTLFAGRNPEEVKQILDSLDEEHVQKLALITSAINNNQLGAVTQLLRKPETNVKETIELINTIVKMNQPQTNSGVDLKGIADIFKAGVEAAKAQTPPQQTTDMYDKFVKPAIDEIKAMREENAKEHMLRLEKEIGELKNRPSLAQELAMKTEEYQAFQKIFGNPGGKTEIDLKLADMAQTEKLENRKIDFEERKWEEQKEDEKQLYGILGKAVEGPISDLTKSLGGAAAKRIETGGKQQSTTQPNPNQATQVQCPACKGTFFADPILDTIICGHCGAQLQRSAPAPQPQPQPQPATQEVETQQPVAEPQPASQQEPQPQQPV